jgi:hypothetical protein
VAGVIRRIPLVSDCPHVLNIYAETA